MDITAPELKEKIERGDDFVLIDVREPYEREEFNIGGQHIPIGAFMNSLEELEPSREKEIVVYCRSGNRSGMAVHLLKAAGFKNPRNLIGGMLMWQDYFGK
jgi:rhodanese-related sulfurtransferase